MSGKTALRRIVNGGLMLSVLAAVTACGIFETREAEPPDVGTGAVYLQPDRPEVVITNLKNAVEHMNTLNYMRSLNEEEFQFIPSSTALESNPDIWSGWDLEEEDLYFNNMRAATQNLSGHSLQIQNQERTTLPDGGERIIAQYTMTVNHNRPPSVLPSVAAGRFIIDLTQGEDGLWSITIWSDENFGSDFTWSEFKAAFVRD